MKGLPKITYWIDPITVPSLNDRGTSDWVYACSAVRNWDVPSNGVFLIFTHAELFDWRKRVAWREALKHALEQREKRIAREYQRRARHHLTDYFDDEIWTP